TRFCKLGFLIPNFICSSTPSSLLVQISYHFLRKKKNSSGEFPYLVLRCTSIGFVFNKTEEEKMNGLTDILILLWIYNFHKNDRTIVYIKWISMETTLLRSIKTNEFYLPNS